jgi:TRAP-type C4-dicarboxylate transport system permease small subunit
MNQPDQPISDRAVRRISNVALWIGAVALLSLALVIVATALARVFGWVIIGGSEIVDVAIIVVSSMSLIAGTASGAHPSVHILTGRLSVDRQKSLKIAASLLACIFFAFLCYASAEALIVYAQLGEYTQLLHINITPFRATWVFALAVVCLVLLLRVALIRRGIDTEG